MNENKKQTIWITTRTMIMGGASPLTIRFVSREVSTETNNYTGKIKIRQVSLTREVVATLLDHEQTTLEYEGEASEYTMLRELQS